MTTKKKYAKFTTLNTTSRSSGSISAVSTRLWPRARRCSFDPCEFMIPRARRARGARSAKSLRDPCRGAHRARRRRRSFLLGFDLHFLLQFSFLARASRHIQLI